MGCGSCSSGGCGSGLPRGCKNNGNCGSGGCNKLSVFDWLSNVQLPNEAEKFLGAEIRFKGSRKEYYHNVEDLKLNVGDVVVVEGNPGKNVGIVSVIGQMAKIQIKKKLKSYELDELPKIYRIANDSDINKWQEAVALEEKTMYGARLAAERLGLSMKISDVEYQADKTKATFYYTAEERVDFRELIKSLISEFKIRVEMRQIGARQESARIGGIGACGRELCCSTWLTDFRIVNISAARYQQLSINPQKLAGQCGKLKCCLNFELDSYVEGLKEFPKANKKLNTQKGKASFVKMDIFQRTMWYSYDDKNINGLFELTLDRVNEIIAKNEKDQIVPQLEQLVDNPKDQSKVTEYSNVVGQDSINRFDSKKKKKKKRKFYKRKKA